MAPTAAADWAMSHSRWSTSPSRQKSGVDVWPAHPPPLSSRPELSWLRSSPLAIQIPYKNQSRFNIHRFSTFQLSSLLLLLFFIPVGIVISIVFASISIPNNYALPFLSVPVPLQTLHLLLIIFFKIRTLNDIDWIELSSVTLSWSDSLEKESLIRQNGTVWSVVDLLRLPRPLPQPQIATMSALVLHGALYGGPHQLRHSPGK